MRQQKNDSFYISAACVLGAEKVLAQELTLLGFLDIERAAGRVFFSADAAGVARALINLRTADRLFLQLGSYRAEDFDQLYEGAHALSWELLIGAKDRLVIEKAKCSRSRIDSQSTVQAMVQKAAYERLCALYKQARMPETGQIISARVRLESDTAWIEVDLSGEALSRRGYRRVATEAPLKESVAAALLFIAGWKRSFPLYDVFCGAGTIPIEAALYAFDIAPGLNRSFTWDKMPAASQAALQDERAAAHDRIRTDREVLIGGSDADGSVVKAALANAGHAGLSDRVKFFQCKAEDAVPPAERGFLFADPPYGKRLGTPEEAEQLYGRLSGMAERFAGWNLCFVVDRENFGANLGRGAPKRTKLTDGAEMRWFHRFTK
ncbi:MAG: class I SAM-dependent RNA methyltransferase [Spirochaetes bacterium]|nr:class I SAM-dependent RNA methyltransferase [Spirochaetota bacterium]